MSVTEEGNSPCNKDKSGAGFFNARMKSGLVFLLHNLGFRTITDSLGPHHMMMMRFMCNNMPTPWKKPSWITCSLTLLTPSLLQNLILSTPPLTPPGKPHPKDYSNPTSMGIPKEIPEKLEMEEFSYLILVRFFEYSMEN